MLASEGTTSPTPSPSHFFGERRQVTVFFSDLSGYTAMTERLDPEEVRDVMRQVFGEASQVISRYGGVVEKYIGDAVMAVFGVTQTHEDDAVRAVRAAWEIEKFVAGLNARYRDRVGCELSMHTGIDTGLVVTGRAREAEGAMGLVGDAVNVASRISDLAQAGQILVGADTVPLIDRFFHLEELNAAQMKGKSKAVQVFRVIGPRDRPVARRRFAGLRAGLVGRDVEMTMLNRSVQRLRDGKGSILAVSGEAGSGKSRLIDEFRETTRVSHQWLAGNAYDHTQGIPYFPVMNLLTRVWDIDDNDTPGQVREKLEAHCRAVMRDAEFHIPYLGALFALEYEQSATVSPEYRKQKIHEALLKLFQALAHERPTIFFIEDAHWADPSTVELLRHVLTHFQAVAITLITHRPPFALFTEDTNVPGYQELELEVLSDSLLGTLISALLDGSEVPAELQAFILEKSGGNPLYVEEVLTSLMETAVLRRGNTGWQLDGSLDSFDIPNTLQGVIAARIDRLDPVHRKLIQEASVIGRKFFYSVVARISSVTDNLHARLDYLEGQDMIRARELESDLEYMFKHPLTQEVVYNSLLIKERRAIHERVGAAIEAVLAERLPEYYEQLAHHFLNSDNREKAVTYLIKSGEKAFNRYSLHEADSYYRNGYELITGIASPSKIEISLLLKLLEMWGLVHYFFGSFKCHYDMLVPMRELVGAVDDKARAAMFYAWLGWDEYFMGNVKEANKNIRKALKLAEASGDARARGYCLTWLSFVCSEMGMLDEAVSHGEKAHQVAREFPDDAYLYTKSLYCIHWAHWYRGDIPESMHLAEEILKYSEARHNIRGQVLAYQGMANIFTASGAAEAAIPLCHKACQIAVDPFYSKVPYFALATAYLQERNAPEAGKAIAGWGNYWRDMEQCFFAALGDMTSGGWMALSGMMSAGMKKTVDAKGWFDQNGYVYWRIMSEGLLGQLYLQFAVREQKLSLSTLLRNLPFLLKTLPTAANKTEYHLSKTIADARHVGANNVLAQALFNLGKLHLDRKKFVLASECIAEAERIFETTGADGYAAQTREALVKLGAKTKANLPTARRHPN